MVTSRSEETSSKEAQVSVRMSDEMVDWLDRRAGENGTKAGVVRRLIEEEMVREEQERLRAMFDAAAEELTEEELGDRELLLGAFSPEEE